MERLTLLQMVADDGSSAPVTQAAKALDLLAGQALALEEAHAKMADMQREIASLRAHNQRLTRMLEASSFEKLV